MFWGFYFIKDIGFGRFFSFSTCGPRNVLSDVSKRKKDQRGIREIQSWNKKFPKRSGGQMRSWIYCMKAIFFKLRRQIKKGKDRRRKESERRRRGVYKLQSFTGVKRADVIDSLCLRSSNNRLMHSDYRPWERRGGGACLCVDMCSHTHMQTTPHTRELKSFLSFSLYLFSHLSKITLPHLLFVSSETLGFSSCYCISNAVQQIAWDIKC